MKFAFYTIERMKSSGRNVVEYSPSEVMAEKCSASFVQRDTLKPPKFSIRGSVSALFPAPKIIISERNSPNNAI